MSEGTMTVAGARWVLRENAAGGIASPVTQTEYAAENWVYVLEGLDPVDCVRAIREHRATSTEWSWLLPFTIRQLVETTLEAVS